MTGDVACASRDLRRARARRCTSRSCSRCAASPTTTCSSSGPGTIPFVERAKRVATAAVSELLDRRDLDQQLLRTRRVEAHVRDALRALAGDGIHSSFAEVVVTDAVTRREHHVAVVAHLRRDAVRELLDRPARLAARERHEVVAVRACPTARSRRTRPRRALSARDCVPPRELTSPGDWRQCSSSAGISCRNRLGIATVTSPNCARVIASERYRRLRARVMPT